MHPFWQHSLDIWTNWSIVVKTVDIVIMAQYLIALCHFFIPSIYRDNMYIISYFFWGGGGKKIRWENLWDFLTFGGLVIRLGLKPRTHSLEGCCSIQLSYRTRFFLAWCTRTFFSAVTGSARYFCDCKVNNFFVPHQNFRQIRLIFRVEMQWKCAMSAGRVP